MAKQIKQYAILHIESGEYLKSHSLKLVDGHYIDIILLPNYRSNKHIMFIQQNYLKTCGILRRDYKLKSQGIYFNDKVSAMTFLRDIYLPYVNTYNSNCNYWLVREDRIRMLNRNEFEIVEV